MTLYGKTVGLGYWLVSSMYAMLYKREREREREREGGGVYVFTSWCVLTCSESIAVLCLWSIHYCIWCVVSSR